MSLNAEPIVRVHCNSDATGNVVPSGMCYSVHHGYLSSSIQPAAQQGIGGFPLNRLPYELFEKVVLGLPGRALGLIQEDKEEGKRLAAAIAHAQVIEEEMARKESRDMRNMSLFLLTTVSQLFITERVCVVYIPSMDIAHVMVSRGETFDRDAWNFAFNLVHQYRIEKFVMEVREEMMTAPDFQYLISTLCALFNERLDHDAALSIGWPTYLGDEFPPHTNSVLFNEMSGPYRKLSVHRAQDCPGAEQRMFELTWAKWGSLSFTIENEERTLPDKLRLSVICGRAEEVTDRKLKIYKETRTYAKELSNFIHVVRMDTNLEKVTLVTKIFSNAEVVVSGAPDEKMVIGPAPQSIVAPTGGRNGAKCTITHLRNAVMPPLPATSILRLAPEHISVRHCESQERDIIIIENIIQ